MSSIRLIIASLRHHWRINLAVAAGVVAATAVLTGALLVGDSMRGSLRYLTLDRLGRIDEVLVTEHFFSAALAERLAAEPELKAAFSEAVPMILLRVSLQEQSQAEVANRANRVNLLGCDPRFWQLGPGGPDRLPQSREIVLNEPLARQLGARQGDSVIVRLPTVGLIPAESPLGKKTDTVKGSLLTVSQVIPAEGLGRFALSPSQRLPRNAYVSLDWLAEQLDRPDKANAILVAGGSADDRPPAERHDLLGRLLKPTLDDYGIRVEKVDRGDSSYFSVTCERLLFERPAEQAILQALQGRTVQPALTYLANTIARDDAQIPYCTVTAIDFTDPGPSGPFLTAEGKSIEPLRDGQIVLNSWAAEDLGAKPGDTIRVSYFEPESTHGQLKERSVELQLAAVVALAGGADDRALTPSVPGVTDQLTMADWDPPFPFDARRIRDEDEQYWEDHGATPKAFVSLATGRHLWSSRFGRTTSLRLPSAEQPAVDALPKRLAENPAAFGFVFQPVKEQGLAASSGTTPFNVLFLSFSFFIIAAAVMLVALLFRLGIEQRAGELGILAALGFRRRKVARLLAAEGLVIAAVASLVGVPVGVGYAGLMLLGLRTWWLAAVVTPFLRLYVTPVSLVIGFASGVLVAEMAILWTVRRTRRMSPRQLLAGRTYVPDLQAGRRPRYAPKAAAGILVAAVLLGLLATQLSEQVRAGAFFGAGAMVLLGSLTLVWAHLRSGGAAVAVAVGRRNLLRIALRNAARNPGRSTLTIGLVASACFLIVAVSAFHLDPTLQVPALRSGNGGFAVVAESDQPIYHDFSTPAGRAGLGFPPQHRRLLAEATIFSLRVKPGDDASCLNLYQPRQPRVLGLPKPLIERGGFAWADSASEPEQRANPWLLLQGELGTDADGTPLVPVVIDKNTAMYSLHLWKGVGQTYDIADGRGNPVRLKVVGLLANSIFQGDLLISEAALLKHFPEVSGYRFFLAQTPEAKTTALQQSLERTLGDYGLATETTGARSARFLAVQNTYLSTFQSLGGLGLLLGTFGLAAVQLRNALERRGELALLRATGFRRSTLAQMVLLENVVLLVGGLGSGVLAAVVAVLPHFLTRAATIPWASLAATLALVLLVGLISGLAAVRATLAAPLVAALRQE